MKHSECRRGAARARLAVVVAALVATAVASCGGPYTPKRLNVAGDKLALADGLYAKGRYARAAAEYKDFLATFAGDERSDYAQFRLAESYRMDKEYALAQVEYQILMNDYGYSEFVDDASFLEGLCAFRQAPAVERDQTKTLEALDRVNRFLQIFPTSPRVPEGRALLAEIHARLGEKDFIAGKLYFSRKEYPAALIYLNKIVDLDAATVWAARARYYRGRIAEARADAALAAAEYRGALAGAVAFRERKDAERRLRTLEPAGGEAPKANGK